MEKKKPGSSWSLAGLKGGAQALMRGLAGKEKTTGQEYLATKGMKPGIIRSVVGTALDIATTPGAGTLVRTGAAAARAGASRLLPRVGSAGARYVPAAGAVGARTGATAAARAGTAGRAALPAATETAQAARVAVQPTALVPRGTSAIAPAAQRAASAGAGAGVGAGAVAGTTQAARAAAAGLRSLGARVAGAGAGVAQRLGAGAAKVGSGLRTAGQFARRNWGKAAALGLAGGLAYGMFAPGNAMEEEVPATMEPETPDQQITDYTGGYPGGSPGGGIGSMTGYGVGGMSEGAGMPGLQEMKDELFSLIDSSVGQNSVMIVSWMNQLLDSINQMEQQLMEQYRQQGSELDPATKAALDELRRDVELRRQTLMEELNRRGLLQSGIWLEEENRLNQGLLTSQERLLASRLSDIQNRINEAIQSFAQQRLNIMGTAWQNEMANQQWAQQARLDTLQNLYAQQLDQSRWAAEYGLDVAKFGLQREKAARSGTDSVTRQFIQAIPEYGSLQEALQAFNQYKGEMAAKGADINAILQNIYTYFGSGGY